VRSRQIARAPCREWGRESIPRTVEPARPQRHVAIVLGVAWAALATSSALAQTSSIIRTRQAPSSTWDPLARLSLGGSVELERHDGETRFDIPIRLEYSLTEQCRISLEQNFAHLNNKDFEVGSVGGLGDLETSVEYEFLPERRYTPALSAEGVIRWPTATDADLGAPGTDFTLGIIASKDLVDFEVDVNLRYTFIGDHELHDTLDASVAVLVPFQDHFEFEAELGVTNDSDTITTDLTLGVAYHLNKKMTIEQGVNIQDDGTWQLIFGWSYSFGGE
jgi:hypothetical protein